MHQFLALKNTILQAFAARSMIGWEQRLSVAKTLLKQYQDAGDNDSSNALWYLCTFSECCLHYVEAFEIMKAGEFFKAWCGLERVEIALTDLVRNDVWHDRAFQLDTFVNFVIRWQKLFPYRVFFSPEMVIKTRICSICDGEASPWSACKHRKGHVYMGSICLHEIRDVDLISISLVTNPVQKYSVPFFSNEQGRGSDHYDYTLVRFVVDRLRNPFDGWNADWTTELHPHERFATHDINGPCPCGSGATYERCCLKTNGVRRPHVQISFEITPDQSIPNLVYSKE